MIKLRVREKDDELAIVTTLNKAKTNWLISFFVEAGFTVEQLVVEDGLICWETIIKDGEKVKELNNE